MKPTAIQWLLKILEGQKDKPFDYDEWKIAFEHALEMEKEQIIKARITAPLLPSIDKEDYSKEAQEYFSKTFKSE